MIVIKALFARARLALLRYLDEHRYRREQVAPHQGATLLYAGELHQLAREPGWLNPEEQAAAARLAAAELVTEGYVRRLERIERVASDRLDRVWRQACATLHLDPIDIEWAMLASGELTTV